MRFKLLFYITIIIALGGMGFFFLVSNSYQNSLAAKMQYMVGDYKLAYKKAKLAHDEDPYNRMAATVMAHSMLALEYLAYIDEAKKYKKKIAEISQKPYIERADKLRIKFMAEIMIESYPKLTQSVVIDQALKDEVKMLYETFKQVHEKVTASL